MSTNSVDTLFLILTFDVILVFLKVAINFPPVSLVVESPLIVSVEFPDEKESLSADKFSLVPFEVVRTYLSSSKGKNVSLELAEIVPVEFADILTSNSFLIIKSEDAKLTSEIFFLGNLVYKVFELDFCRFDVKILKSLGLIEEDGSDPSHIPRTVVTPTIVSLF